MMNNATVIAWLIDAATLIGVALLAGSFLYGLLLLFVPSMALRASSSLNRRFSSRRALRPLEIPRRSEPFFYRHHRVVGALLLAGVVTVLALYFLDFPRDTVISRLGRMLGRPLAGVLLDTATRFMLLANVLIGVLAVVMILRPSLLKPVEQWANRWLSTRRAFRAADVDHVPLDRFAARYPRLAGALIAAGSAFIGASALVAVA